MKNSRIFGLLLARHRTLLRLVGGVGLVTLAGCGGAGAEGDPSEASDDSLATQTAGLHSSSTSLPWRGAAKDPVPMTTAQFGVLDVVWRVDIGMTRKCSGGILGIGQECHHELQGLQVFTYSPTNPNNTFTAGDRQNHTVIGKGTAGGWTTETCPANSVVVGYTVAAQNGHVERLGITCKNVLTGVGTNLPDVGSSSRLFGDILSCSGTRTTDPTQYVGSLQVNRNGNSIGAGCVRP